MNTAPDRRYVIATDVGGTCTDTVVFAPDQPVAIGKALSTPPDFAVRESSFDSLRGGQHREVSRNSDLADEVFRSRVDRRRQYHLHPRRSQSRASYDARL